MIRLAHPQYTRADWERLWPILESGRLVQGATVAAFEAACAARLGVPRSLAVSSGTAALHLALDVCQVSGGEVVVPAFGWPAAANVAERLGARVRAADVDPETLNLDLEAAAAAVGPSTRALVAIHLFGMAVPRDACLAAARTHPVVEDAACAFGATDGDGHRAGTWGRVGCFSLHARKGLSTGEGGLLIAAEEADFERLARLRNHGAEAAAGGVAFVEPGLNYRLNELAAALGLGQLERFEASLARRRALAARYREQLATLPGLALPACLSDPGHAFQSFVVALGDRTDRRRLIARLAERGVEATVGTYALHLQPYYRSRYGWDPDDFPVARWAHEKLLALPLHEGMSEGDVDRVCQALEDRGGVRA